jgi:hypothetical protein
MEKRLSGELLNRLAALAPAEPMPCWQNKPRSLPA